LDQAVGYQSIGLGSFNTKGNKPLLPTEAESRSASYLYVILLGEKKKSAARVGFIVSKPVHFPAAEHAWVEAAF